MFQAVETMYKFLTPRKATKGGEFTHLSMGKFKGSFLIEDNDLQEFYQIYQQTLSEGEPLSLLEKHSSQGPVVIDLDLRANINQSVYTIEDIRGFIRHYNKKLLKHLQIQNDEQLICFVMENNFIREDKGVYKSGIHLMYPYCCTRPDVQHSIRNQILEEFENMHYFKNTEITNGFEDIFDKCVIDKNAWFLYGSGKMDSKPYQITHIFDNELDELDVSEVIANLENITTMAEFCSIRKFKETDIIQTTNIKLSIPEKKVHTKLDHHVIKNSIGNDFTDDNIETAKFLVSILSSERADNYQKWLDLGFCLHNISYSLLDVWNEFSKKNTSKYKPGECMTLWERMKDEGLNLGSLHRWAREDNPDEYLEFRRRRSEVCMVDSLSCTHFDFAKLMFELYNHQYVFVGTKRDKCWYEFINHRWVICENGNTFILKIPKELAERYHELAKRYYGEAGKAQTNAQKEDFLNKAKTCEKIINNLKTNGFIKNIVDQCEHLFFDCQFHKKLNENPDLMAFNNGVLEIPTQTFRDGRPEDYISISTGYNYIPLEQGKKDRTFMKYYKQVKTFFQQIQPEPAMMKYLLTYLAGAMWGYNKEEIFPVWIGGGCNGKSMVILLLSKAFGEYAGTGSISTITQPRAGGHQARPDLYVFKSKRFISFQEPNNNDVLQPGPVKEFTGGDDISCRGLYKEQEVFSNQADIVMCTNVRLPPAGNDGGFNRRVKEIPFEVKFCDNPDPENMWEQKIDRTLKQRLESWVEPFLTLLIHEYLPIYFTEGLIETDKVTAFTREYQQENDRMMEFINDCIVMTADKKDRLKITTLFNRFKSWYKEAHGDKCPSRNDLKNYLNQNVKKMEKLGWTGMKLRTDDDIEFINSEPKKQSALDAM